METKFNFKSQICTSVVQSRKLLELGLKKETADCMHNHCWTSEDGIVDDIPAWSLHRLLLLIPKEVNIDGYRFPLRSDALMRLDEADDMYEYLIGVLERTIKEGYFNKEYLV